MKERPVIDMGKLRKLHEEWRCTKGAGEAEKLRQKEEEQKVAFEKKVDTLIDAIPRILEEAARSGEKTAVIFNETNNAEAVRIVVRLLAFCETFGITESPLKDSDYDSSNRTDTINLTLRVGGW